MDSNSLLILVLTLLATIFWFVKKRFDYWTDRGVPSIKRQFPSGSLSGVGFTTSIGEKIADHYVTLKGKGVIGGLHFFISPTALVLDLDLLRNVLVKDFQYFQDRGVYVNEEGDPLSAHLFHLEGEKWRTLRAKMSPTFTSGKLKMMHSTLLMVADQFKDHLRPMAEKGKVVDIKELCAQFTTDIIGNVAFGLECNSMENPDSEFRKMGKQHFEMSSIDFLVINLLNVFPKVGNFLNLPLIKRQVSKFFIETIRQTVEYREKNNVQRNDLLQLLLQIKNQGKLDGESEELGELSFNELAAQTFVFFLAGFETSSSTMTFAMFELSWNQDIQNKAREEIRKVLKRHNGEMSYEAVMEMNYLDQIIKETLRKYPIVSLLRRKVKMSYKVPGTDIVLPKNMLAIIPVLGIHRDPEIYPDPEKFDPDRFTKENVSKRHLYAWLPFGEGPRNCIGLRFGMMQTRIGLAALLADFKVRPSPEQTPSNIEFETAGNLLSPVGGMHLIMETVAK